MRTSYFPCGFFLFSFCIPRLISSDADWMSTILPHMVWPWCEFRMQVWNVLHAARWKYRTHKWCKKSPSAHHRTTSTGYIFATKARIDNRKKNVKQQYLPICPYNMVNFGPLAAEIVSLVWGTPANFNGFRVLAALLHSQTAALNRGCHLYSAGRPSRWALAHISSIIFYFIIWNSLTAAVVLSHNVYFKRRSTEFNFHRFLSYRFCCCICFIVA